MRTVLDLNNEDAKAFFLKKESYCSFELPEYISFETLLQNLTKELSGKILQESTTGIKPKDIPVTIEQQLRVKPILSNKIKMELTALLVSACRCQYRHFCCSSEPEACKNTRCRILRAISEKKCRVCGQVSLLRET